jgi:hypothetical protein
MVAIEATPASGPSVKAIPVTGSFTITGPLAYKNAMIGVRFHNIGRINPTTGAFEEAENKSSVKSPIPGNYHIDGVYIPEEPVASSCLIPAYVRGTGDLRWKPVAYNPVQNEFVDYVGPTLGAGYEFTDNGPGVAPTVGEKWHNRQRFYGRDGIPDWGTPPRDDMNTWVTDGSSVLYYTTSLDGRVLRRLDAMGTDTVVDGPRADNGNFHVLHSMSCGK